MCGITGYVSASSHPATEQTLARMEAVQIHRGPDAQSVIVETVMGWTVGFGHQRLAVIDLTDAGTQPMSSASGRFLLVFNGEIYNYLELAESLSVTLRTNTDTEVLLEHIEQYGLIETLYKCNGMWAFALLDRETGEIHLCRDRLGIKPLYYRIEGSTLYFSSEVKGILEGSQARFALDSQSIFNYVNHSVQDASEATFFQGIQSVPSAHMGSIDLADAQLGIELKQYWATPTSPKGEQSFSQSVLKLRNDFIDAVKLRMRSDVPLGVTLSGGIDSSSIAAVMNANMSPGQPLGVLSAVSSEPRFDESTYINAMAQAIDYPVSKVELDFDPVESMPTMREATWHNDAPLGTFSNLAYLFLMRRAKQMGLTVVLSGQGADELLCGYKKYLGFHLQSLLRSRQYGSALKLFLQFARNGTVLAQVNFREAKRYLPWTGSRRKKPLHGQALNDCQPLSLGLLTGQTVSERQLSDTQQYSVPYLLHYEDRMSMACSVEVRLPFLDYRLVEQLIPMPTAYKLSQGWTKFVLREAMKGLIPDVIAWRKDKLGFINPEEKWLHDEMKPTLDKLFSGDALMYQYQLIEKSVLLERYHQFCNAPVGKGQVWYREIFAPFALEVWLQTFSQYLVQPESDLSCSVQSSTTMGVR